MATINESIEKLKTYIKEIEDRASVVAPKLSDDAKTQVSSIANKTIDTINKSIEKIEELKTSVNDESALGDFLSKLDERCKDIADYTVEKINEFRPSLDDSLKDFMDNLNKSEEPKKEEPKETSDLETKISDTYNRLINNPNVVNATNMVKTGVEKAIEFYNSEETQDFINTMKIKTINIAEKGLEELKVILDRADKKNDD